MTKCTVFINDLVKDLGKSGVRCMVGDIKSSPEDYATALAAATVSKCRTDR